MVVDYLPSIGVLVIVVGMVDCGHNQGYYTSLGASCCASMCGQSHAIGGRRGTVMGVREVVH